MSLEMIKVDEQLSPEVTDFIDKHFAGKDPQTVIRDAIESYKLFEAGMGDIDRFRKEYNDMGWVGKKWNQRELAENTNEAVLKLCKMSDAQAKMQLLVLIVTAKLGQQQTILSNQQRQIKEQTERISYQQGQIEGHQGELEVQNQKLIEQQGRLEIQARRLQEDNVRLIEASEALRALRSIGQEHDEEIVKQNKALSELESFYVRLRQTLKDMDDAESLQDCRIDKNATGIAENRSAIEKIVVLGRKLDDLVSKNFEGDRVRDEELARQREKDDKHDAELERQRGKDNEHDRELERQRKKDDEHDRQIKELFEHIARIENKSVPVWVKASVIVSLLLSIAAMMMALAK